MADKKYSERTAATLMNDDDILALSTAALLDRRITGAMARRSSVTAGITASTTQTQGNGALTKVVNQISVCANANDTVTLPTAVAGLHCIVINDGAQTCKIFPASADNLGAGVDTAVTLAAAGKAWFVAFDTTNWQQMI